MEDFEEGDRQLVLLSLALCSVQRPGFYYALAKIADQFDGRHMFDEFRRLNAPPGAVIE
jgi:hypothetical protein